MKKSIKILALILTLALVCGVFVIGAFATEEEAAHVGYDYADRTPVTGETILTYMDYEAVGLKNYGPATEFTSTSGEETLLTSNTGSNAGLFYAKRQGEAAIVAAEKGAANQYLEVTMGDTVYTGEGALTGPYQVFKPQNVEKASDKANYWSVADVKYIVVDADVFFPTTITGGPGIHIEYRAFNKDGTRSFTKDVMGFNANGVSVSFGSDFTANGNAISQDKWTHVTFINKYEVKTDDIGEYVVLTTYLALDGKLTSYSQTVSGESGDNNEYDGDRTAIYPHEVRFSWGNATDGTKYLNDNVAIRKFDNDYEGNLADLLAEGDGTDMTAWDGNVYDPYNMPYGTTVATREVDGEVVEYDNLQKAINEAEEEETITLVKSASDKVAVEKALFIDRTDAGYTCSFAAVDGYAVTTGDTMYTIEPATDGLTVYWYPCDCGNDCFEEAEIVVYEGNNIYEAYYNAMGYYPTCAATEDPTTHAKQSLKGFADTTGIIENFTTETVVTAEMVGETVELAPVYETIYPVGMRIVKSTGAETYYYDSASFLSMFGGVGANNTIKLLADLEMTAKKSFNHTNVTLDLNGYNIISITEGTTAPTSTKYALFNANGKILNVTSTSTTSVGTIYHAMYATNTKTWVGDPVFNAGSNGTVNLYGADENGNTTLRVYTAVLFNDWSGVSNYNIDGGEYYRTASDHEGFIYGRGTGTGTFKNAYIYGAAGTFAFCGVNTATTAAGKTGTYVIDNCVIESTVLTKRAYSGLTVTFTNSYIKGNIESLTALNNTAAAPVGGEIVIGEGCLIAEGTTLNGVSYAGTVYEVNSVETIVDNKNDFTAEDKLATTAAEITTVYNRYVGPEGLETIEVIWVDTEGNELGRTDALPGVKAAAPTFEAPGTNGMVMASYSDWVGGTKIPVDAEDGYTLTVAEDSGVTYTAGKIDVLFNFTLVGHYQYNYYLPEAPEGVVYTGVNRNGSAGTVPAPGYTDYEGNRYSIVNIWPSAHNTDNEYSFSVTYTYEGATLTYVAPTISMTKYVNYIFTAEKYANNTAMRTMFADMMRVIEQANITANSTTDAAFDAVYAMVEPYMSVASDVVDPDATNDFTGVADYLEDVSIVYHSGLGAMTVGVTAKDGYYGLVYGKAPVHGAPAIGDNREINNGGVIYGHNVRAYALSEVLVISFYAEEDIDKSHSQIRKAKDGAEPVATVELTMAGLVNDNAESFTDAEKALVDAFFAYSISSRAYMEWRAEQGYANR